jgi:predicted phage replisome organizer
MPFGFFEAEVIQYISAHYDHEGAIREWSAVLVKAAKVHAEEIVEKQMGLLESLPSRDSIILIWIMMLALAGRSNAGGLLVVNGKLPYSVESLAALFRRPEEHIRMALCVFKELGMVEIAEGGLDGSGIISIPRYDERFLTDHRRRAKKKERQSRYRERKAMVPPTSRPTKASHLST